MEKKFIAIDLGAESGRCMVGVLNMEKIELYEVHRFTTYSVRYKDSLYWDILAIYGEIIEGLKMAQRNFGSDFESIGVDTWGVDYVLMDYDDRILGYPYHYRDSRTDNIMEEAFSIIPKEKIYLYTGIQFMQINTLFQLLAETKKKTNFLKIADKILFIPDFINFLFSGKKYAEYTIASTSSLIHAVKRDWAWDIIDAFGLPRRIFPQIVKPGTILGKILPSIVKITQLSENVSIIATACHDTASAVVSIPAKENNWIYLSSGTWSLIGLELNEPILNDEALINNFTNEGGYNDTILFLRNIVGLWPLQECKRYWSKNNIVNYDELVKLAIENGPSYAWINLYDQRFLKSERMPEKIISYLIDTKQRYNSDVGFIVRVIIESLAFCYREAVKKIELIKGEKINNLYIVGGGAQNKLLNQLTADATGCKVIAGPVEASVLGNIGVQAITLGIIKDIKEWRRVIRNSFELEDYLPKNSTYFNMHEFEYEKIEREIIN